MKHEADGTPWFETENSRFGPENSGPKRGVPFTLVFIGPAPPKPKILSSETGGPVYLVFSVQPSQTHFGARSKNTKTVLSRLDR